MEAYKEAFTENNLALEYKYVTRQRNGMEVEDQVAFLDWDHNLAALEGHEMHKAIDHDGLVKWSVVDWTLETGFFCKKIQVQYGNCPWCYRPLPIGWECEQLACSEAGDNVACWIYVTPPGGKLTSCPAKKKACDPFVLARVLQLPACVSLDASQFKKQPQDVPERFEEATIDYYGYRPDSSDLWRWVDVMKIIDRVDFSCRPFIECDLRTATKVPIVTIKEIVNNYKAQYPEKFTDSTWKAIKRGRKVSDILRKDLE